MLVNTYSDISYFTLLLSTGYSKLTGLPTHRGSHSMIYSLVRQSLCWPQDDASRFCSLTFASSFGKKTRKKTLHKNVLLLKMSHTSSRFKFSLSVRSRMHSGFLGAKNLLKLSLKERL